MNSLKIWLGNTVFSFLVLLLSAGVSQVDAQESFHEKGDCECVSTMVEEAQESFEALSLWSRGGWGRWINDDTPKTKPIGVVSKNKRSGKLILTVEGKEYTVKDFLRNLEVNGGNSGKLLDGQNIKGKGWPTGYLGVSCTATFPDATIMAKGSFLTTKDEATFQIEVEGDTRGGDFDQILPPAVWRKTKSIGGSGNSNLDHKGEAQMKDEMKAHTYIDKQNKVFGGSTANLTFWTQTGYLVKGVGDGFDRAFRLHREHGAGYTIGGEVGAGISQDKGAYVGGSIGVKQDHNDPHKKWKKVYPDTGEVAGPVASESEIERKNIIGLFMSANDSKMGWDLRIKPTMTVYWAKCKKKPNYNLNDSGTPTTGYED